MMRAQKDDAGFMSAEQQNNRYINILQLAYLSANKVSGSGYMIPNDVMEKIETELDFNTHLRTNRNIVRDQKKKYRKRKSYLFWWDILSNGNYSNYDVARDVLMSISKKTGQYHQSMTHVRYAMETLHLALDDYFGTNKVKITPNRFLSRNVKPKAKPKAKSNKTKKAKLKKVLDLDPDLDVVPF